MAINSCIISYSTYSSFEISSYVIIVKYLCRRLFRFFDVELADLSESCLGNGLESNSRSSAKIDQLKS